MYKLDCFLVSTDHLTERLWFRDDEDFKVGMNYVALVSLALGIHVLAFILMSNHIHLVLACSEEEALRFITEYKRRYSKYYQKKYSVKEFLRRNGVDIRPVATEEESLERAVAYVQMNSVAANICSHPSSRGSATLFSGSEHSRGGSASVRMLPNFPAYFPSLMKRFPVIWIRYRRLILQPVVNVPSVVSKAAKRAQNAGNVPDLGTLTTRTDGYSPDYRTASASSLTRCSITQLLDMAL